MGVADVGEDHALQVAVGLTGKYIARQAARQAVSSVRPARSVVPGGRFDNVDIVLIRENTEGLYSGVEHYIAIGPDPRAAAESTVMPWGAQEVARSRVIEMMAPLDEL